MRPELIKFIVTKTDLNENEVKPELHLAKDIGFYGYMHGLIEFNSKQHSLISAEISTEFNSIKVLQSENLENCDIEKLTLFKN